MTIVDDKFDPSNPSHRSRMMNFLNELEMAFAAPENQQHFPTSLSVQNILVENEMHLPASQNLQHNSIDANRDFNFSSREPSLSTEGNSSLRGNLSPRIARLGFSAPTINTDQVNSANMASTMDIQSSYLNISPGHTPSAFFESTAPISNASISSPTDNNENIQNDINEPSGIEDPVNDISENSPRLEAEFDGENDRYNWRKYGQKPVKGSEYPRSYYKCTHPSCPVKKKVERSQEGYIIGIIYKGTHNHDTPVKKSRLGIPPYQRCYNRIDASTMHGESNLVEFGEHSNCAQNQDAANISSPNSADHESEDGETHASIGNEGDGEGDDNESYRRSVDSFAVEMNIGARGSREPRVVIQTVSEVEILDDGYRWRKYGQKVVKGNSNPRSYYKCTSSGCTVRKHIERASNDPTSIVTTYEGKHNHEVPPARRSMNHPTASYHSHTLNQRYPEQLQNSLMNINPPSFLNNFNLPNLDYGVSPMPPFDMNNIGIGIMGGGMGQMGHQMIRYPVLDSNIGADGLLMLPKEEEEDQTTMEAYDQLMAAPLPPSGSLGPPM